LQATSISMACTDVYGKTLNALHACPTDANAPVVTLKYSAYMN